MGLLNNATLIHNTSDYDYYTGPSDNHGNYQFTSLNDIIDQFMIAYTGEDKIVSRARRVDVAFHAQRAMQELSFDTFKSCKAMEIAVPSNLAMTLPRDYVNYTKVTWSDNAGIEHLLYPTSKTSNPFNPKQNDDGTFDFVGNVDLLVENYNFSDDDLDTNTPVDGGWTKTLISVDLDEGGDGIDSIKITDEILTFTHGSAELNHPNGGTNVTAGAYAVWQKIDVSGMDVITKLSVNGISAASSSGIKGVGVVRVGFCSNVTYSGGYILDGTFYKPSLTNMNHNTPQETTNVDTNIFDIKDINGDDAYLEFNDGAGTSSTKSKTSIDVSNIDEVYILITSHVLDYVVVNQNTVEDASVNKVDNVTITFEGNVENLQSAGLSDTLTSYKSHTPNDNIDKYDDGTYDLARGERYGIHPQYSQTNGSFYIDCRLGKIRFSSNISGKTVTLHYISDGLGTDDEMQVHKFAEEAMYKYILCEIMSLRKGVPEYAIQRYKKDKRAAIRQAKLRLSNIKLEEITQIFRGKSKWIKH
jgi:hypothetical protein